MAEVHAKLKRLSLKKTAPGKTTMTAAYIGQQLGITGQTVSNFLKGKGRNGYLAEAMIEEYEKLPDWDIRAQQKYNDKK